MLKEKLKKLLRGYITIFKSIFFEVDYSEVDLSINMWTAIIILLGLGLSRAVLSALWGIKFPGGAWWSFRPGVLFATSVFPIFMCFFPAMILDYAFSSWESKPSFKNILGLFFHLQVIHLIIFCFDLLMAIYRLPHFLPIVSIDLFFKLAISPLAMIPLILLITPFTSVGIQVAWLISFIVIGKYCWHFEFPLRKLVFAFCFAFYFIYVIIYPFGFTFFAVKHNFYYGMVFLLASIGPILYFKLKRAKEIN